MKSQYEVNMARGGPTGEAAAISAARRGAHTLLVEQVDYLGGMATNAKLPAFCMFTNGKGLLVGGVGLEIQEAMKAQT